MVFGATFLLTACAVSEMYAVLNVGGLTLLEYVVLVVFALLFVWIALACVSATVGFLRLMFRRVDTIGIDLSSPLPMLTTHNAILLPTYNEEPHRVFARLRAVYESVAATGQLSHFDFFVLSDTTDPSVWVSEVEAFSTLREVVGPERLFYRRRLMNVGRKAGNIANWVTRFGGAYEHMIVLDADSLMSGETIVRLAAAMESRPTVGLIQTLPVLINGVTLFARIQQFAGRIYGPVLAYGIAWWHGSESNYWGHNAIIRVSAFAAEAGLPNLVGRKPFGGHILSHDFVEAALLRRAGWEIHLAPHLEGSFEEPPPTLTDFAIRDRRWCQGNLQHLKVVSARGLHWVSRLHLLVGIVSYITSPLWLLFLLSGMLLALQAQFVRPEYFVGRSLFPQWPAQDPIRAAWLFAATMGVLLTPKFLGLLSTLIRPTDRHGCGGAARATGSAAFEILLSGLIAPIMMLRQTRAVVEVFLGRDSGWAAQKRDSLRQQISAYYVDYRWPMFLGLGLGASAYAISLPLFFWMSPVLMGLALAVLLAWLTSDPGIGASLTKAGVLRTPEETLEPPVAARARMLMSDGARARAGGAVSRLLRDPSLLSLHMSMLDSRPTRKKGELDVDLLVAKAKIADSDDFEAALDWLTEKEKIAVLGDPAAIEQLSALLREPLNSPQGEALF